MISSLRFKHCGMTLVELLIGIVIGVFIASAALGMLVSMIQADSHNIKIIQLNQVLRGAMGLMSRDIRRAGANQNAATDATGPPAANPFSVSGATRLTIAANATGAANTCITYSYDENSPYGSPGSDEKYGFRYDAVNHTVESLNGDNACSSTTGWADLTDKKLVHVSGLSFTDTTAVQNGINIRQITITLSGNLVSDNTISRTITESVKLRNDEF